MRAVVQRVKSASVAAGGRTIAEIGKGLLVFLGIEDTDETNDCDYICEKVLGLRIFDDENEKMNLSVLDTGGSVLLVSQFTLCGDARKGRRPSFIKAAVPEKAVSLYEYAIRCLSGRISLQTGEFREHMEVSLVNDGPVTILLESKRLF
ncbi:MAG: D-tyrosyl-tRNA(Tyr) deacylase [Firmicutes bacterium ADurb.Bin182]|nr:MAG: D-tyrosyl-tRNA(Tyr) deacylase [Firmicutes bacterium ADurb.Bin182]